MRLPSRKEPENERVSRDPHIVPAEQLAGEDDEETALLQQMLVEATNYAVSFSCSDLWKAKAPATSHELGKRSVAEGFSLDLEPFRKRQPKGRTGLCR
jgi:hypothetical protein